MVSLAWQWGFNNKKSIFFKDGFFLFMWSGQLKNYARVVFTKDVVYHKS